MLLKMQEIIINHVKTNSNKYFFLLIAFVVGVSAGAFTVNGLSMIQREDLNNYFQGFLQLLENQKLDDGELLSISLSENYKQVLALWVLGLTIIGIPFIFLFIGIRGFLTGFSAGFIFDILGLKGILFVFLVMIPKEIILVPCIIAVGVNGVNFSLNIIKNKSNKSINKTSLKSRLFGYCMITGFYSLLILIGCMLEVYVTPIFIRMIAPYVLG